LEDAVEMLPEAVIRDAGVAEVRAPVEPVEPGGGPAFAITQVAPLQNQVPPAGQALRRYDVTAPASPDHGQIAAWRRHPKLDTNEALAVALEPRCKRIQQRPRMTEVIIEDRDSHLISRLTGLPR